MHNLSQIKIDNKSNSSSFSVILEKEHNLHMVRIGYKNWNRCLYASDNYNVSVHVSVINVQIL